MPRVRLSVALLLALTLPAPAGAAAPPHPSRSAPSAALRYLELLPRGLRRHEALRMLTAILADQPIGPGAGWFGPARSAYDWKWLAGRLDADRDGAVSRKEFKGPADLFARLDRDGDGRITAADFDWSPRSPFVRQARQAEMLFRRADGNSDGRLSAAEWQALFRRAARGKDHLTPDNLRALLFPPPPPAHLLRRGMPSREVLLRGFFSGEIGSPCPGPAVGQVAPDFTLDTHDGLGSVSLRDYRGKKPVVLIFGSFT
jgi:hypothetical protein